MDAKFREFPDLLFVQSGEYYYFDATDYLNKNNLNDQYNVCDFRKSFALWFKAVGELYSIPEGRLVVSGREGHLLVEESLALLFIAYTDPVFRVYLLERVEEMFLTGIALSDTALLLMARNRFAKEELTDHLEAL